MSIATNLLPFLKHIGMAGLLLFGVWGFAFAPTNSTARRVQIQPPSTFRCAGDTLIWTQTDQKSNDSSLNSRYSYEISAEGIVRTLNGLSAYVVALDVETRVNMASVCGQIDRQTLLIDGQTEELKRLRAEVDALKQANRHRAGS